LGVILECLIDPGDPVAVVAALVGLFFGLDYETLVAHRLEGGGFDPMRPGDRGRPAVLEGLQQLNRWWRAANDTPADIFMTALVSELGLLPYAAAGELGSLRAGALVYALDAVRSAAIAGQASLPGAHAALVSALDLTEAEAPLEPGRTDVVRLMNLHQAKGLEAPVVVLADPSGCIISSPSRK
jgi:ATP-dependent helicase/nuclease subunit A